MVIFWQDCCGKGKFEKKNPFEVRLGKVFCNGNAYSYSVKKGYSYLCMWMT